MKFYILVLSLSFFIMYRRYAPHLQLLNSEKEEHTYFVMKDIFTEKEFHDLQKKA